MKPIGQDMHCKYSQLTQFEGYDHSYCLKGRGFRKVARVHDAKSGRGMVVFTDFPAVQLYTANQFFHNCKGKGGAIYQNHQGFCLETQHYPDAVNLSQFPSPFYKAGEEYRSVTVFQFICQ